MKDYKITKEEFLNNKGYSSHCFFNHSLYFLEHSKNIHIDFYRCKIMLSYGEKKLIIRCHYKNKSKHFATILDINNKEIMTFRDTIEPSKMNIIINLLLQ